MANIVILDGYELNNDLDWRKLKNLGNCTFYNRSPINDDKEVLKRIGD
ncbi:D-2-hydroxyacid dehydrogenase, partial [Lactococcus cremoris]|nr:D-2-hydroxyacid dehydrogenase [Lactococcus cremoris]